MKNIIYIKQKLNIIMINYYIGIYNYYVHHWDDF